MIKTESVDELISKEKFFIDMYNAGVDRELMDSFEDDVLFFTKLGIKINYHKKTNDKSVYFYLEPHEKKYGTIGYHIPHGDDKNG